MSIWPVYVLAAATLFSRPACTRKVRSARPASVLRRSLVRKPGRKHGTDGALAATTRGNIPSVTGLPVPSPGYPSDFTCPSNWSGCTVGLGPYTDTLIRPAGSHAAVAGEGERMENPTQSPLGKGIDNLIGVVHFLVNFIAVQNYLGVNDGASD